MPKDHTSATPPSGLNSPPTPAAWRLCGNQLKRWRVQADLTRERLGQEAGYSYEAIKSMETGRRKPTRHVLDIADDLCQAGGKLRAASDYLEPEKYPARTQEFMEAEASAVTLYWYETMLVPGLLQTENYARALLTCHCPPLDDETVADRLAARLKRQDVLTAKPRTLFGFVVHEAALRTTVGGTHTMRDQLLHLAEVGQLRNVTVQVLTFGCGAHSGLNGPLVAIETEDHQHYAYVEGQETGVLYSEPREISALNQRQSMIRALALTPNESARFIRKVAEEQ